MKGLDCLGGLSGCQIHKGCAALFGFSFDAMRVLDIPGAVIFHADSTD
jgi:hypothetical protein